MNCINLLLLAAKQVKSLATDALSSINIFSSFVVTDVSTASKVKSQKGKIKWYRA
jgi:hypothetical protein